MMFSRGVDWELISFYNYGQEAIGLKSLRACLIISENRRNSYWHDISESNEGIQDPDVTPNFLGH